MGSYDDIDLYAILGVAEDATAEQIQAAWKKRFTIVHPDQHGGDETASEWAKELSEARDILTDPHARARYDAARRSRQATPTPPSTRFGKLTVDGDRARRGGVFEWTDESSGVQVVRRLRIPAGVTNGQLLRCPAEVIAGQAFPAVEFVVVVHQPAPQQPAAPPARPIDIQTLLDQLQDLGPTPGSPPARAPERSAGGWWPWAAGAAVVVLAAGLGWWALAGSPDVAADEQEAGTEPENIIPTGEPTTSPAPAGAAEQLQGLAKDAKSTVRSWPAGSWVPQLSAKCAGLQSVDLVDSSGRLGYPDGSAEEYPAGIDDSRILAFHQALDARFQDSVVLVAVEPSPSLACAEPVLWVSLLDEPAPTRAAAQAWCAAQELPAGECAPNEVTAADLEEASYLTYADVDEGFGLEVPYFMAAAEVPRGLSFADQASGARLTVTAREADPGATIADERAAAIRELAPGAPPDLDDVQQDGFRISGVTADGTIYYWRGYRSGAVAYDLVWRYPQELRAQFDAPVERSVGTFEAAGTP